MVEKTTNSRRKVSFKIVFRIRISKTINIIPDQRILRQSKCISQFITTQTPLYPNIFHSFKETEFSPLSLGKFLEQANVRIEITSTVTISQNGCEQSGFEGYDLGSIALKDQSRALGDLGSQCQEGQSYDMGAGQQQAQPCRPASQLTLELTDESQINSQSGKVDDFIPSQTNQQQKDGPNHQT
ncbi:MAG: hypothetical protein EZS28_042704, partial [Streblomastix strix]